MKELYCKNCDHSFTLSDVERLVWAGYEENTNVPVYGLKCPNCGSFKDYREKREKE